MSAPLWTWLALAFLLLALILALIAAAVFWRRTRLVKSPPPAAPLAVAALQKSTFGAAMATLYPRDNDLRYDKPCVLVCGAAGDGGAGLLRGAGLEPVIVATGKDSGWWRSSEGVAFDLPAAAWEAQGDAWTGFLRLLDRHRGRRALDAIVWHIPLAALEQGSAGGERMYRKFVDIQDRLGLRLPVYVVIGGCEQVDGFGRWAARLPEAARAQALGWSNPNGLGTAWRNADGEQGVARLVNRLRLLVSAVSTRRDLGNDAASIFVMPDQLGKVLARLPPALQEAMRENAVMTPFDLRGIYLSGRIRARQDPAQADPFGPAAPPAQENAPVFCRDLFAHRVFGEFGLAQVVQRRLDAEKRSQLVVLSGACLFAALWLVCLVPSYIATRDQLREIEQPLRGIKAALAAPPGADGTQGDAEMRELLTEIDNLQDWHTPSYALPPSWHPYLGGLRAEIDGALKAYYQRVLFKNIDRALRARAVELSETKPAAASEAGALAPNPEGVAQFAALSKFVEAAYQFEYQRNNFTDVTTEQHGSWKDIAKLLDYLFEMKLNEASPETVKRFDRLLKESRFRENKAIHKEEDTRLRQQLDRLHQAFLDGAFEHNRLFALKSELLKGITTLNEDKSGEQVQLAKLQKNIGELGALLRRTDAAWMVDGELVNSEAYRKLEANMRKSRILGQRATELRAKAMARQLAFQKEVIGDDNALRVLDLNEGKHLQVNADLGGLEQALGKLLLHRFAQGAPGEARPAVDVQAPLAWHTEQLNAAQAMLAELETYEAKALLEAPPAFQATLQKLARLQAGAVIERHLSLAVSTAMCETGWRCANFEDARKALAPLLAGMRQRGIDGAARRWEYLMDTQALALLTAMKNAVESGSLYLPDGATIAAWDGSRGGAASGYGVRGGDGEIREYLDAQLQAVGEVAMASKGPRAWLAQKGVAAPREMQTLLGDWNRVEEELAKHAAKVPTGSLARLEKWFSDDLAKLDITDCAERLPPTGGAQPDFFQRRMAKVAALFGRRCFDLESGAARRSYGLIAAHFNEHLRDRYPFAATREAAPADPEHVRQMLQLLEANKRTASILLRRQRDPASMAAAEFIKRLGAVQPLLAAMLAEDPAGGFAALDLWPQFRVNREREKGGDQVFEWLVAINDGVPLKTDGSAAQSWRMADKIALGLRWAKNSSVAPAADLAPQGMHVDDATVSWRYDDPWALLRVLTEHAAPESELSAREAGRPVVLGFKVPTRENKGGAFKEAVVYARLEVSVHGKPERLRLAPFPTGAAPALAAPGTLATANANENGETR